MGDWEVAGELRELDSKIKRLRESKRTMKRDCQDVFKLVNKAKRTSNGKHLDEALLILCKYAPKRK